MQNNISAELEKSRAWRPTAGEGRAAGEAVLNNKIEALKVLTRALLKEIESLAEELPDEGALDIKLIDEVRRFEADLIRCALVRTGGRQRRAAHLLKMKVGTLNAKIKRYNLDSDELVSAASNLRRHLKAKP